MLPGKNVTIPPGLKKRLRSLATEDEDLLQENRDQWENHCLRAHYRRVWEKLGQHERKLLREKNPDCMDYVIITAVADYLHRPADAKNPFEVF